MIASIVIAATLITLHGLDGQEIYVNPRQIVSVREPQTTLLHTSVKCSIQTSDGKLINVTEVCAEVTRLIEEND